MLVLRTCNLRKGLYDLWGIFRSYFKCIIVFFVTAYPCDVLSCIKLNVNLFVIQSSHIRYYASHFYPFIFHGYVPNSQKDQFAVGFIVRFVRSAYFRALNHIQAIFTQPLYGKHHRLVKIKPKMYLQQWVLRKLFAVLLRSI